MGNGPNGGGPLEEFGLQGPAQHIRCRLSASLYMPGGSTVHIGIGLKTPKADGPTNGFQFLLLDQN